VLLVGVGCGRRRDSGVVVFYGFAVRKGLRMSCLGWALLALEVCVGDVGEAGM
jgi:hypothetical protein